MSHGRLHTFSVVVTGSSLVGSVWKQLILHLQNGVTDVGCESLERTDNRVLDSMCLKRELPLAIATLETTRPEDSGAVFCSKKNGSLGMPGGKSPRHSQNPLLGERRRRLATTHLPYHSTLKSSPVHNLSHQRTAMFLSYYNVT